MNGGRIDTQTLGADPEADNAAGTILIKTGRLEVTEGGQISSASSVLPNRPIIPTGAAGMVRVVAPEVLLSGQGSQLTSSTAGTGRGGDVVVETDSLTLMGGARVDSSTRGDGQGGTVTVTATDTVTVVGLGSGLFTETAAKGAGGDIVLHTRAVQLTDGATVSAKSAGTGNAGKVRIVAADTLLLRGGSTVTTGATSAKGGNIEITAQTLVRLQDSQISTAVGSGEGTGGNITIDPEFVLLENSRISANASGGPGGNITINTGVLLNDRPIADSITATSDRNIPGAINIHAQITNPSGLVTPLLPDFAPVGELLHDPCVERLREGTVSSFVVRGRASLPVTYDSILPSRLYEPQQPQTPTTGVGHPSQETTAASPVLTGSAGPRSSLRLDLPCARP
jgi:large exoprotein involved in heme utilization and adhesion